MRTALSRNDLLEELTLLQGIVERRTTIPILSHVLLHIREGRLHLAGTDLDVSFTTSCEAAVDEEGSVAVQARKFTEIIRSLAAQEVRLEMEDGELLRIESGASRFKIHGLAQESFPTLPQVEGEEGEFAVPLALLRHMISRVIFAISTDESRFQLHGALLRRRGDALEMVATDGHRLALVEQAVEEGVGEGQVLVPRKALQEILRLEGEGTLTYRQGPHHLSFGKEHRELTCRILEGTFPDYERVISPELDKTAIFDRKGLLEAVQRVALLTGERARGIRLEIDPDGAVISAANPDLGEAQEQMPCDLEGGPVRLGVNPDYLAQFLGAIDTEKVRLDLKDEHTQCIGYPVDTEEKRYLCVIMPMRV